MTNKQLLLIKSLIREELFCKMKLKMHTVFLILLFFGLSLCELTEYIYSLSPPPSSPLEHLTYVFSPLLSSHAEILCSTSASLLESKKDIAEDAGIFTSDKQICKIFHHYEQNSLNPFVKWNQFTNSSLVSQIEKYGASKSFLELIQTQNEQLGVEGFLIKIDNNSQILEFQIVFRGEIPFAEGNFDGFHSFKHFHERVQVIRVQNTRVTIFGKDSIQEKELDIHFGTEYPQISRFNEKLNRNGFHRYFSLDLSLKTIKPLSRDHWNCHLDFLHFLSRNLYVDIDEFNDLPDMVFILRLVLKILLDLSCFFTN